MSSLLSLLLATAHAAEPLSYEPTGCDGWAESGRLRGDGRVDAAVTLEDGRVLLVGLSPKSPQIFDPARAKVTSVVAPGPWKFLSFASAAVVDDDTTVVVGAESVGDLELGKRSTYAPIRFAYRRSANRWDTLSCPEGWGPDAYLFPAVTRLTDGRVVAFDGVTGAAELNLATLRWSEVVSVPRVLRGHKDVALASGELFVVGTSGDAPVAYRFHAEARAWSSAATPPANAYRPRLDLLPDGRVLELSKAAETYLYDPIRNAWDSGPALLASRSQAGATILPDGSVLVAGGWDQNRRRVPFAEIWRPGTDEWAYAGTQCVVTKDSLLVSTDDGVFALGGLEADGYETENGFGFAMKSTARIERWERSPEDLQFVHGLPPRTLPALSEGEGGARPSLDWVGAEFPDLRIEVAGKSRRVSSWTGVRVIDVWATWCPPCIDAIPELDAVAHRWSDRDVTVLMLSVDADRTKVASFQSGIHHAVVGWSDDAFYELALGGIPELFVLDAEGRVLAQHHGGVGVEQWLDAELEKAAAQSIGGR